MKKESKLKNYSKRCLLDIMFDLKTTNDYARTKLYKRMRIKREWLKPIFWQRRVMHKKPIIYGCLRFVPRKCKKNSFKMRYRKGESLNSCNDINKNESPPVRMAEC